MGNYVSKTTSNILFGMFVFLFASIIVTLFAGADAMASTSGTIQEGVNSIDGESDGTTLERIIEIVINAILFLIGVVSVVMIIIGGFRYVVSNGDSNQMAAAKNTILYAIVGLVIAIAAYAIINFVLGLF